MNEISTGLAIIGLFVTFYWLTRACMWLGDITYQASRTRSKLTAARAVLQQVDSFFDRRVIELGELSPEATELWEAVKRAIDNSK